MTRICSRCGAVIREHPTLLSMTHHSDQLGVLTDRRLLCLPCADVVIGHLRQKPESLDANRLIACSVQSSEGFIDEN